MGEVPIAMWGLRSTATWAASPARAARRPLAPASTNARSRGRVGGRALNHHTTTTRK